MSRGIPAMIKGKREYEEGRERQRKSEIKRDEWEAEYNKKTPQYAAQIEKYAQRALGRYEHLAKQGIAEQQRQNFLTDIDRSTSESLAQRSSRRGGLTSIGELDRANRDAYRDLLEMDATTRLANQFRLADVAPEYEGAGDRYTMEREMWMSDLNLDDIYEDRDYGRWQEQEGFRKHQEGWKTFDEDLMTWMTMGMGGGMGGGMSGGNNSKSDTQEQNPYEGNNRQRRQPRSERRRRKRSNRRSDYDEYFEEDYDSMDNGYGTRS